MSGSSLPNFTLTRNPGDENLCYFKTPDSTFVLESSVWLLIVQALLKMAIASLVFVVLLCYQLVLNGEVVPTLM